MRLCSRCGHCCSQIKCGIGSAIFGEIRECPALERVGDQFACGLVLHPSKYVDLGDHAGWKDEWFSKMVSGMLGIELGCCSSPQNKRIGMQMREFAKGRS
jgi:hypothetical protein